MGDQRYILAEGPCVYSVNTMVKQDSRYLVVAMLTILVCCLWLYRESIYKSIRPIIRHYRHNAIEPEAHWDCQTGDIPSLAPYAYNFSGEPDSPGIPFGISDQCWTLYHLPPKKFATLDKGGKFLSKFVFVTGASSNHFDESLDAISSIQAHWPGRNLIYYDLGLAEHQASMLTGSGESKRRFCDVEYRLFNFSHYPSHVKQLTFYAFKLLIINEVLQEYEGIFWIDASIRFRNNNLADFTSNILDSKGFVLFKHSGTSIWAVTDTKMYEYIPSDTHRLKNVQMGGGGDLLIFNTHEVYEHILKWLYACALVRECIAPSTNRLCRFRPGDSRFTRFGYCHRFDQSLINLLLANWWDFDENKFFMPRKAGILDVVRQVTHKYKRNYCPVPSET